MRRRRESAVRCSSARGEARRARFLRPRRRAHTPAFRSWAPARGAEDRAAPAPRAVTGPGECGRASAHQLSSRRGDGPRRPDHPPLGLSHLFSRPLPSSPSLSQKSGANARPPSTTASLRARARRAGPYLRLALLWAAWVGLLCLARAWSVESTPFDPWDILQVPRGADEKAVRRAYRALSLQVCERRERRDEGRDGTLDARTTTSVLNPLSQLSHHQFSSSLFNSTTPTRTRTRPRRPTSRSTSRKRTRRSPTRRPAKTTKSTATRTGRRACA